MEDKPRTLLRLSDTQLDLADPADDIRHFKVADSADDEIGHVKDLFIDDIEKRVRFLEVVSGGFLGIGETEFLIPVDVITGIKNKTVRVNRTRDHVAASPLYDPKLTDERSRDEYYRNVYGYWGVSPFWVAGYAYPSFPAYP